MGMVIQVLNVLQWITVHDTWHRKIMTEGDKHKLELPHGKI